MGPGPEDQVFCFEIKYNESPQQEPGASIPYENVNYSWSLFSLS